MTDLIDTTEMYLRTVFELEEEGITPLRARIAERLGHSGPTVSQTVARMERDGLLAVAGDRHIELSEEGRRLATRVMRKHRIAERLLVDVIGLEWEYVHDEACRWEHVMSDRVERKILALLADHAESPYGNPIPGLDEFGECLPGAAGDVEHEATLHVPERLGDGVEGACARARARAGAGRRQHHAHLAQSNGQRADPDGRRQDGRHPEPGQPATCEKCRGRPNRRACGAPSGGGVPAAFIVMASVV